MNKLRPRRSSLAALLLAASVLHGQTLQRITLQEHLARLPALQQIVNACAHDPSRCAVPDRIADESFALSNGVRTHVSYAWLRTGLGNLAKSKPAERETLAAALQTRLQAESSWPASTVPAATARTEADHVLSQVEFAKSKPGVLQEQWDRWTSWLGRHFSSDSNVRGAGKWLTFLLEAALFGVPLLLLGLWLLRQVREDRLRPASLPGERQPGTFKGAAWADVAQQHAHNGEWRDAVHALYWQSITGFEQRRIWSVARHRTPREYLRLLEAGSPRRALLRELTLLLEHVWYGHAPATEDDFQRAHHLAEELALA